MTYGHQRIHVNNANASIQQFSYQTAVPVSKPPNFSDATVHNRVSAEKHAASTTYPTRTKSTSGCRCCPSRDLVHPRTTVQLNRLMSSCKNSFTHQIAVIIVVVVVAVSFYISHLRHSRDLFLLVTSLLSKYIFCVIFFRNFL